jgi:cysteinyl-tRNA synthetase
VNTLNLYNTLSRRIEELRPISGNTVRMYTCGPTVYNFAHIGNFRTYLFEDLLRRSIIFFGMKVEQVMNITDIDDKTLLGAIKEGVSLKEFTEKYKRAFFEDLDALGIQRAEHYPEATAYIPEMIDMIEQLLKKGIAYKDQENNVYYAIKKFPFYGKLSHLKIDELKTGASKRISSDEYDKENLCDFVLWKAYDPARDGNIFWESPFGKGRPGWHIECSAMATKILGETIDLHVGGVDNLFPHHENEIAQCEGCSGKTFVHLWMHAEHLLVDHKKMSKSLGNFYTLRDLLSKGYSGKEIRLALLAAHYRTQLNFTMQSLDAARSSFRRITDFVSRLKAADAEATNTDIQRLINGALKEFTQALSEDLNISGALAAFFDFIREVNTLFDQKLIGKAEAQSIFSFLEKLDAVLGFLPIHTEEEDISSELQEALVKREEARACKDWKEADRWRDFLLSKGYLIEDTPAGSRLKRRLP